MFTPLAQCTESETKANKHETLANGDTPSIMFFNATLHTTRGAKADRNHFASDSRGVPLGGSTLHRQRNETLVNRETPVYHAFECNVLSLTANAEL
jgi:hypothetical protein